MTWAPDLSPHTTPEILLPLASPLRNLRRALRAPALALSLLILALLLASGALAHGARAPKNACSTASAHRAHDTIARRCAKHSTHKAKRHAKRKPTAKKPSGPASKKWAARTPATCEDASLPVRARAGAHFTCSDGSQPACEDGSTPTRSSTGAVPLCPIAADTGSEEASEACEQEAEEGECPAAGCEEASAACQADPAEKPED